MKRILLVEDSKEIHLMVVQALQPIAEVVWAADLATAREHMKHESFDVFLLDVELPDGQGYDLCSTIQNESPQSPIFFLTAHGELSDKVMGFAVGADDYITKPFSPVELRARVEARIKKMDLFKHTSDIMKWKTLKINKARQEVHVLEGAKDTKVDLTSLEFKLLSYLANRPYEVIHRDELLDQLWGVDVHVYARSVDTHVSKLRKKLGCASQAIQSVHGTGYKFSPEA
jgi:DNA-binding response OmpR family regulator